ncbi:MULTISPECIES: N-acetylmuramoyl-L-alanine amidase [Streptomyces]|uniref:N-acetylmuramoyl-L-alanine amidase n=1 Tax=Streptomyces TaxID=1883 RepID=UPI002ED0C338|nr:N-acetylmuramoyl-L-alanine amidase [Streptomyces sp. NBC_00826]WTH94311.1 N-acetylmuramoyl-L-alanine amidase [Streptomyces sp. NBC_00825]WTI03046.1 N-acetylmuramoyl-L-alanine amidase [Streptomyces sp. NBC_00822]
MAAPLTAERLLQALRAEGVHVVEVGNWRTHNRNSKGPWGPLNGSIVHHTVTKGTESTVRIVRDGYPQLPGPLCHGMIAKNGQVHLVGWGRTNHAGGGDPRVLDQVVAESYSSSPTPPTRGNANGVDGNAHFYGWECENLGDGKDPWPAAQYDAIVRVQAALCRAHGWSAKSVIGHREWSADKVDPRGIDMPRLRADVAERLKHPASWNPGTGPNEEDPMAGITKRDIFDAVWKTDAIGGPSDAADHSTNPTWQPQSILKDMQARIRSMDKRMAAQTAAITALAGQVGTGADTQTVVSAVEAAIQRAVTDVNINTREI